MEISSGCKSIVITTATAERPVAARAAELGRLLAQQRLCEPS